MCHHLTWPRWYVRIALIQPRIPSEEMKTWGWVKVGGTVEAGLCVGWPGRRGSGASSGFTAWAVETGQCQYFSRTASDKLGHLQYFLSKLGYPPAAAATRGHWAAGWPRNGHLLVCIHLEFQPLIPGHWQTVSLGGSKLYNSKWSQAHSCCWKLFPINKGKKLSDWRKEKRKRQD